MIQEAKEVMFSKNNFIVTLEPLIRWFIIRPLKVDPKSVSKQKMYKLYRKITIRVIFLYNQYIFVWIQHSYLAKMVLLWIPTIVL